MNRSTKSLNILAINFANCLIYDLLSLLPDSDIVEEMREVCNSQYTFIGDLNLGIKRHDEHIIDYLDHVLKIREQIQVMKDVQKT